MYKKRCKHRILSKRFRCHPAAPSTRHIPNARQQGGPTYYVAGTSAMLDRRDSSHSGVFHIHFDCVCLQCEECGTFFYIWNMFPLLLPSCKDRGTVRTFGTPVICRVGLHMVRICKLNTASLVGRLVFTKVPFGNVANDTPARAFRINSFRKIHQTHYYGGP